MISVQKTDGLFVVFESPPKCGKTTLAAALSKKLASMMPDREVANFRGALSASEFGRSVSRLPLMNDVAYSSAFFWADAVFNTLENIIPSINRGGIVVQDRYDLSIVTYRELFGLNSDSILMHEYCRRDLLIHPDITVLLDPGFETARQRMLNGSNTSAIDRKFYEESNNYDLLQRSYRAHIAALGRDCLVLDTNSLSVSHCVSEIIKRITKNEEK